MMIVKARVRRDGELAQVPMEELVPGDIVMVEAGDLVPGGRPDHPGGDARDRRVRADRRERCRCPSSVDAVAADAALGDRVDMAFMNTQVTRGAGTIVVTSTGMATEVGHISGMLSQTGRRRRRSPSSSTR